MNLFAATPFAFGSIAPIACRNWMIQSIAPEPALIQLVTDVYKPALQASEQPRRAFQRQFVHSGIASGPRRHKSAQKVMLAAHEAHAGIVGIRLRTHF